MFTIPGSNKLGHKIETVDWGLKFWLSMDPEVHVWVRLESWDAKWKRNRIRKTLHETQSCNSLSSETRRGWKFGLTPLPSLKSTAHQVNREILPYIRARFAFKMLYLYLTLGHRRVRIIIKIICYKRCRSDLKRLWTYCHCRRTLYFLNVCKRTGCTSCYPPRMSLTSAFRYCTTI